ncbi:MAG: RNA polymerase sigma factor [Acidimicrobiia bacterium]|nr:RNA polymerase sigma factor [Acidimicrobiia bacterium]
MARLDEGAFTSFYGRATRALWSYVYRVTGNAADADDIVQEAFLRLLRAEVGASEEDRRRYLYRIASNLIVDRWRIGRHEEGSRARGREVQPAADIDRDIAHTFAELAPRERALLWLAYVEEDSHEEIASSLGLRRGSIKVLLFRARRRLRDLLRAKGIQS